MNPPTNAPLCIGCGAQIDDHNGLAVQIGGGNGIGQPIRPASLGTHFEQAFQMPRLDHKAPDVEKAARCLLPYPAKRGDHASQGHTPDLAGIYSRPLEEAAQDGFQLAGSNRAVGIDPP